MSRFIEKAKELRAVTEVHYNCAQSVFIPFAEEAGMRRETAFRIAANFGGGMKMGSVCGAVTGGLMALGLFGVDDPDALRTYYQKMREGHEGILDCAGLLRINQAAGGEKKPYCDGLVCECVRLTEDILRDRGVISDAEAR